jgi:hypothetical protein
MLICVINRVCLIPNEYFAVLSGAEDHACLVRMPHHAVYDALMSLQATQQLARVHVPEKQLPCNNKQNKHSEQIKWVVLFCFTFAVARHNHRAVRTEVETAAVTCKNKEEQRRNTKQPGNKQRKTIETPSQQRQQHNTNNEDCYLQRGVRRSASCDSVCICFANNISKQTNTRQLFCLPVLSHTVEQYLVVHRLEQSCQRKTNDK